MAQLFEKFEVNRDPRWKMLAGLVGASFAVHFALLFMVIYVPALRDTVNIVALVAGTRFVDKEYDASRLADDVQWIQVGERFHYPEGYFTPGGQVAAEQAAPAGMSAAEVAALAPKIISLAANEENVPPETSA